MEEKKEFLDEWKFENDFEKPIAKINKKKFLSKKTKRESTENLIIKKENKKDSKSENNKIDEHHQEVIIGDAADLTEEQKLKRKFNCLN